MVPIVSSPTALAFVTNVSEKCKSASLIAIGVNNGRKTIGIGEKLEIISRIEKHERMVNVCCNVKFTHCSIRTICDNADRIKGSAKSGRKAFV
jgi:hypothetical protein